jgi:hypothetical protein
VPPRRIARAQTQDRFIAFRSSYACDANANIVTVTRDGNTRFKSEVCSPEEFAQMRTDIETIERDTRTQVIVRSTLSDAARSTPRRVAAESPGKSTHPAE